MDIACLVSELSADEKIRVGCCMVKEGQVISQGWNGQPSGMPNDTRDTDGTTYPTVIHSEANALMKLTKNGGGSNGATIYCTHSPCMDCALLLLQAGIVRVVYDKVYCEQSLKFLKERGLKLDCIKPSSRVHVPESRNNKC